MEEDYDLGDHPEWIPTKEQEEAGITASDLMREFPPQEKEGDDPEAHWPVDGHGLKIPMNEWTVSDIGSFPDEHREWLIREHRKRNLLAGARLLEEMSPSEIASDTAWANLCLGGILDKMGLLAPELRRLP